MHVAGDALQPTSTATTVRIRDGKALVTDGPFAETKEQRSRPAPRSRSPSGCWAD
jgi:hypothetical protein